MLGLDFFGPGARVFLKDFNFVKKYQLASLLWLISSAVHGQNLVDIRTQTKNVDFSGAASTIPAKSGTALPATCNPGELFFKTNSSPGQNLYGCAPANTWTQLSGSSNGTVSTASSGQFGFYAGSGNTIIGHTLTASDIPALSYQAPLLFTGTGTKTASSAGSLLTNDCAKWDASGNIIDAGAPCASVASGSAGQFGFYSATGNAISPHTLVAADIPALNYQAPLAFTGSGTKTVSSAGTFAANDCAKWDASGNVIDAGIPCANVASGTAGQFGFYSASGTSITPHTLVASDIPALNYQAPLSFTGNGTKAASATGTFTVSDCAKWDANGNIIDAGSPCATVAAGTTGQFAVYSASGSALAAHTLTAADIPALSYQAPLSFTGTGTKTISSTAAGVANNCAKWDANGNVVDAGAPCGTGSGSGSTLSAPSTTTVGNVPQYSNATGTALSAGLGIVTTLGNPGLDTNLATEKAVRTALAAAAGNTTGFVAGPSGALCTGTGCVGGTSSTIDVVTSVVPLLAAPNTFTGVNKFQQLQVSIYTVATLPACNASFEGQMEGVSDAVSPSYLATVTGGGSTHVPVYCNGTSWVAH